MKLEKTLRPFGTRQAAGILCAALGVTSLPAAAVDVDAGDYTALPAGTNLGVLYYQHAEDNKVFANGNQVAGGNLKSDTSILRGVHYMDIGGFIVDPQFLLPFGNVRGSDNLQALGSSGGTADLILAATVWLVNNPDKKTYFGVTPYLFVPTGSYDRNRALNLGEHRWKETMQAGFITPLVGNLILDLIADVTIFGDNKDYGPGGATLKQDPLVEGQVWLRYNATQSLDVRVGFAESYGGRTTVNGVSQQNRTNTNKFSAGFAWFPAPTWQVLGIYGQDISVQNGPKEENHFKVRLLKVF
ncbi:transporter [Paraburkholderia elongata]|uniref:Transporter n=1 Tax=Paraburkholderia elongata TaxID=2675747 RepID=A0A972SKL0_9BURK|nr:transporter [Paraburkholderia elongata]NPT54705.1 transporter [Paraburkholderia elongata]